MKPTSTSPAYRTLLVACVGAATTALPLPVAYAQAPPASAGGGPAAGSAPQTRAPVDPQSLSCNDLKAELKSTGEMSILSGPKGAWADTFYGPTVPRCQFYQMPLFAYVRARDGRCGVGYICVDKVSVD